jgi:general stress protein YciG
MARDQDNPQKSPSRRGFAAMDKDRQREIARKGGASVPDEKRSFSQDRDLAAAAGRKGGEASHGGGRTGRTEGRRPA